MAHSAFSRRCCNGKLRSTESRSNISSNVPHAGTGLTRAGAFVSEMAHNDFDSSILDEVAHRPWTLPESPWVMTQTWNDVLFAHWRVDASTLRERVPASFELDLFDGEAWVAVVPFEMTNVGPRGVPSLPWVSEFPELNVRTYVKVADRPGVYFFSLDAGSAMAVRTARMLFNLPYFLATMNVTSRDGVIDYQSRRESGDPRAELRATYQPAGEPFIPQPGSLEYFLTERYCLYHLDRRGVPYRLDIHHPPWKLQRAAAELARNTMAEASGVSLPSSSPLVHFVKRQDMVGWLPAGIDHEGRV